MSWVFGVGSQFRCERSDAPEGRAEGAGNLCSDPENARSRISFPSPFGLSLSKPCVESSTGFFAIFRGRSVAAAGDLLFFVSPKKPKEKKGDPTVCVPPLRCGQPAVLSPAGVELELASLKQSLALFRLDFRSSAHTEGGEVRNSGSIEPAAPHQFCYVFNSRLRRYCLVYRPKTLDKWLF